MSFGHSVAELVGTSPSDLVACADHWTRIPLGEVAEVVNGFPFKSDMFTDHTGTPLIRIRDVTAGHIRTYVSGDIPEGFWVENGDLIIGMDGDFNLRVWTGGRALLNQRVCKVVADDEFLDLAFAARLLPGYLRLINEATSSITVKHLSSKTLDETPIPIPPLPEQRRIVAKLDRLSARSAAAREHLARTALLAARAKQATLAAAFDDDRADASLVELIGEPIRNGLSVRGADEPPGIPALRLSALRGRFVDVHDVRYLPIKIERAAPFTLRKGDVLVSRGNGNRALVGIASIVPEAASDLIFPDTAFRIRLDPACADAHWFAFVWSTPQVRAQIEARAKTTAGIWKVSQADLRAVKVPHLPLHEQREIVRRIEAAFARIDRLAEEAARAAHLLDRLDERLLARAFRGELVPQDPADEPADALLARIREARANAPKPKRTRRTASTS